MFTEYYYENTVYYDNTFCSTSSYKRYVYIMQQTIHGDKFLIKNYKTTSLSTYKQILQDYILRDNLTLFSLIKSFNKIFFGETCHLQKSLMCVRFVTFERKDNVNKFQINEIHILIKTVIFNAYIINSKMVRKEILK